MWWNYICYGYSNNKNNQYYASVNVSINCHTKKVRYHKTDCYILHTVLLAIILLMIITAICSHFTKHSSKQKGINALTI